MKKILSKIYPFLIAIYPVLALKNFNNAYVDLASILRSLIIMVMITAIVWLITYGIFRERQLSGIITSLVLIGFLFVLINLIVDLLYYVVDPRLRVDVSAARGG